MRLLEMSISAGVLILLVAFFSRGRFWKLSKRAVMLLWMVVLARLLLPGSLPMRKGIAAPAFDLLRRIQGVYPVFPRQAGGIATDLSNVSKAASFDQAESLQGSLLQAAGWIWLAGMCGMGVYVAYSYWKEYRLLAQALTLESIAASDQGQDGSANAAGQTAARIRECCRTAYRLAGMRPQGKDVRVLVHDRVRSPLVFGIVRQNIVIPKDLLALEQTKMQHVLTHEMVHIRRHDNLWKLFSAVAVCIHWFNPLVWLMYLLFARDLELSCDEHVLAAYGSLGRQEYAMTLVTLAQSQKGTRLFCSGFLENPVKERIVAIMKYKKLTGIGILCAGMLFMCATSVFATNGKADEAKKEQANLSVSGLQDAEEVSKTGTVSIKSADQDSILLGVNPDIADNGKVKVTFHSPVCSDTEANEGQTYSYHIDGDGKYILEPVENHEKANGEAQETRGVESSSSQSVDMDREEAYNNGQGTNADEEELCSNGQTVGIDTDVPKSTELLESAEWTNAQASVGADETVLQKEGTNMQEAR